MKTYVFKETEVVLTGKRAERKLRTKTDTLYEIKPADSENGTWTKWVRMTDLYEIVGEENNNESDKST